MTRRDPRPECREIAFAGGHALDDASEVALEDYARVVLRAEAAEALREGAVLVGIHACGLAAPPSAAAARDVEDFAHDLAARAGGGGLGWS